MRFQADLSGLDLGPWTEQVQDSVRRRWEFFRTRDAKSRGYLEALARLPQVSPSQICFDADAVLAGVSLDLDEDARSRLIAGLEALKPWRKGPFSLFGVSIDAEWASNLKWDRLKDHIAPLEGRRILDIGSSCGYYLFRMAASRPALALGVEPFVTFYFQFCLLNSYLRAPGVHCLPLKLEDLPELTGFFDTVFCMGMLYHNRSPIDALKRTAQMLRPEGELVLETLVIEGEEDLALCPQTRYAKMHNVYFLPTVNCLSGWLHRAGFEEVRCVDVTATTSREQRKTPWIQTESLEDFLDPQDPQKTVEGYPAPLRALVIARRR